MVSENKIKKFKMFSEGLKREVIISVRYAAEESNIYLYFFDGQNLYDKNETEFGHVWAVDKVIDRLGLNCNVVGIYSLNSFARVQEYLPYPAQHGEDFEYFKDNDFELLTKGFKGDKTAEFIVNEVIPAVEKNSNSVRMIGGSSMGGVMSLYTAQRFPDVFKKVLAMSTAAQFIPEKMAEICASFRKEDNQRVYIDAGDSEGKDIITQRTFIEMTRMLYGALKPHTQVMKVEGKGHEHNEDYWSERLPSALKFLFDLS